VKGEDIKNEIYNWLVVCQVCALEDAAFFDLNSFCVLWQIKGNDRWEECKYNAFYQLLHCYEVLDIQRIPLTIGESFPMCICK
jgi:hypothetical protein